MILKICNIVLYNETNIEINSKTNFEKSKKINSYFFLILILIYYK